MSDVNQLIQGLGDEPVPQVDWNAPEQGSIPPPVNPGLYTLRLRMSENQGDWFDTVEVEVVKGQPKKPFPRILYGAEAIVDSKGNPIPALEDGKGPMLNGQRASLYKSEKMALSNGMELIRAMGFKLDFAVGTTWAQLIPSIVNLLQQANGQATFRAEIIWRAYFKGSGTTISTSPNKKRGEIAWPRLSDGSFADKCQDPQTGETAYGFAEINRFKLPTSD